MEIERNLKPIKEISLIPLINVVFLLLIFFMVAGTLERFDVLKVETPLAESGEELNQSAIVIVLGSHDEVLMNDDLGMISDVEEFIVKQLAQGENRPITIRADSRLEAIKLMEVIEEIRSAGGKNLTLAVQGI